MSQYEQDLINTLNGRVMQHFNLNGVREIADKEIGYNRRPGKRTVKRRRSRTRAKGRYVLSVGNRFISAAKSGKLHPDMSEHSRKEVMETSIGIWLFMFFGRVFITWVWDTYFTVWSSHSKYYVGLGGVSGNGKDS